MGISGPHEPAVTPSTGAFCYVIFDAATGKPLVVDVKDRDEKTGKVSVIAQRVLAVFDDEESAVKARDAMFGNYGPSDPWTPWARVPIRTVARANLPVEFEGITDAWNGIAVRKLSELAVKR